MPSRRNETHILARSAESDFIEKVSTFSYRLDMNQDKDSKKIGFSACRCYTRLATRWCTAVKASHWFSYETKPDVATVRTNFVYLMTRIRRTLDLSLQNSLI